ncbi:MAG: hypothetical protein IT449_18720 [Phycisphaerales bacterium]|nr:hypothetical protein [Phycisphaerales bacterium]
MRLASTVLLAFLFGCGNTALLSVPQVGGEDAVTDRAIDAPACDPQRTLQLQIVTESTFLSRDLPQTGLSAGSFLPAFDAASFGLAQSERDEVVARIRGYAEETLAPFGIEVIGDGEEQPAAVGQGIAADAIEAAPLDGNRTVTDANEPAAFVEVSAGADAAEAASTRPAELIARIILTHAEGVPQHCGCQGSTGGLGLPADGPAEGAVFANAFVDNGLAEALLRYSREERIEKLAAALANSVLHEAGHTLGLVHLDVPGQPTLLMARGGASAARVSLAAITTRQTFSDSDRAVTPDALSVREWQCDTCMIEETLAARRRCGS